MDLGGLSAGPVRLRPPSGLLDPRAVGWWQARCAVATGAPAVALAVVGGLVEPMLIPVAVGVLLVGAAATAVLPRRWYDLHRWEITDNAVYVRSGYLRVRWRLAPLAAVQTVDTRTGPLQRAFGLATLVLTAAGGVVTVAGLCQDEAIGAARRIGERTDGRAGDAT